MGLNSKVNCDTMVDNYYNTSVSTIENGLVDNASFAVFSNGHVEFSFTKIKLILVFLYHNISKKPILVGADTTSIYLPNVTASD